MAKQTKKTGANKGHKKVQVKELSKAEENLSAEQMKEVKGGQGSRVNVSEIQVSKVVDSAIQ